VWGERYIYKREIIYKIYMNVKRVAHSSPITSPWGVAKVLGYKFLLHENTRHIKRKPPLEKGVLGC
jgi:hypothetical protein